MARVRHEVGRESHRNRCWSFPSCDHEEEGAGRTLVGRKIGIDKGLSQTAGARTSLSTITRILEEVRAERTRNR